MISITPAGGPMKTRAIMNGNKRAGWIRPQSGRYMVKIYGAKFISEGMFAGSATDCKLTDTLSEAITLATETLETT